MTNDGDLLGQQRDALADLWRLFATGAVEGTSPYYEAIAAAVPEDPEILDLILAAPPVGHLPPALLAAVHDLVLLGRLPELAECYDGRSGADPVPLFAAACRDHRDEILDRLARRRVQTNEVRRSALLVPGLAWAAAGHGAPLDLVDVGCSAGLNLGLDRYRFDYGAAGSTGPPDAALSLACRLEGGDPPLPDRVPELARRTGIDLNPPDVGDPEDVRWLLACTWPGTGRLEHTRRALELAALDPPAVLAGDALDLLPGVLADGPGDVPAVVVTTWAFSYFPPEARPVFIDQLAAEGRRRPVVWLACDVAGAVELDGDPPAAEGLPGPADLMTAVTFGPDGARARVLAQVQSHGEWLAWAG
jgi:hypothetical protein